MTQSSSVDTTGNAQTESDARWYHEFPDPRNKWAKRVLSSGWSRSKRIYQGEWRIYHNCVNLNGVIKEFFEEHHAYPRVAVISNKSTDLMAQELEEYPQEIRKLVVGKNKLQITLGDVAMR